jgi:hypothetical protein
MFHLVLSQLLLVWAVLKFRKTTLLLQLITVVNLAFPQLLQMAELHQIICWHLAVLVAMEILAAHQVVNMLRVAVAALVAKVSEPLVA